MVKFLNAYHTEEPLTNLDLGRIINLKDPSINSLVSLHGQSLKAISLHGLDDLTSHSLKTLFGGLCANLEEVECSWIRCLDDELFDILVKENPKLRIIKVYGCNLLSEFSLLKKFHNSFGEQIKIIGNEFD